MFLDIRNTYEPYCHKTQITFSHLQTALTQSHRRDKQSYVAFEYLYITSVCNFKDECMRLPNEHYMLETFLYSFYKICKTKNLRENLLKHLLTLKI